MAHKWALIIAAGLALACTAAADQDTKIDTAQPELPKSETVDILPAISVADYEADQTGGVVGSKSAESEPAEYAALGKAPVVMDSDEPELSFTFEEARLDISEH